MLPESVMSDEPQDPMGSQETAAGDPAEGEPPVDVAGPDPREPVLEACADAILALASRVTVETDPDSAKGYGQAAQAFAETMALINPPMKPIDPNLHADHRGVDPQKVYDATVKAEEADAEREHQAETQAADQAHELALKAVEQQGGDQPST